jgi:ribosomal protein S18 acetylase RimI-like enzyme
LAEDILIEPLREHDIAALVALARDTWMHHYPSIIGMAQIEYMLAQRYQPEAIRAQLAQPDLWWDVLRLNGQLAAFAAYETGPAATDMKIDKLYARHDLRGRGMGSALLRHVAARARARGCTRLWLQVNRHNASAIAMYLSNGLRIEREAVADIGGGFVMDDYIMGMSLAGPRAGAA